MNKLEAVIDSRLLSFISSIKVFIQSTVNASNASITLRPELRNLRRVHIILSLSLDSIISEVVFSCVGGWDVALVIGRTFEWSVCLD